MATCRFFCHEINIYSYYLMTVAIIKLIFMMSLMLHMAEQTVVTTLSSLTNFVLTTFSFCPLSKFLFYPAGICAPLI